MDVVFTFAIILYCLSSLVVCQSGNDGSFEIVRGNHDTFRNLKCWEPEHCTEEQQCETYEAKCVNDECKRCRCHKSAATFLVSGSRSGKCTKDEDIIPESVPEKSFMLKNIKYQRCLTSQNGSIVGTNCPSSSLIDMRWMLIKHDEYFKLMSVGTLQCLEFLQPSCGYNSYDTGNVTLKTCNRTDGQKIQLNGEATSSISSIFDCSPYHKQYYNLVLLEKTNNGVPVYLAASIRNKNQMWSNHGNPQKNIISYTGCYRFQNEQFMLYLDKDTTCHTNPCSRQFSAPIFMQHTECGVDWTNSTIQPYDGVMWENITEYFSKNIVENLAYIEKGPSENSKILKIKQEALERFNGSLVKLAISCSNKNTDENEKHCLLLKFKSPPLQNEMENMGQEKAKPTETMTVNEHEGSINPLAIAVPVSLLAVILVLILVYFVWYRKRRAQKEPENQGNLNNPMYNTQAVYADPNRRYETPESRIPTATAAPAKYEYIDNNDIAKQNKPEPELKYDYAANTDIPRITLNTKPASEEQKYDYATVDTEISRTTQDTKPAPEELKYDYAANTDVPRITLNTKPAPEDHKNDYATVDTEIPRTTQDTKPAPEELKYDYAANTDIPRITLNTKPVHEDQKNDYATVDTEIPRTTQVTKPAPEELKYDYAANTDIPRIAFDTKPASKSSAESPELKNDYATVDSEIAREVQDTKPAPEDVVDPPGNVYHTLEEPSPPQGAAVYSTLEDPAAETNPLVTYDTPHSGDPVYNVLEDSNYSNP